MRNYILPFTALALLIININAYSQTQKFPNVKEDLVDKNPLWGSLNFEMTISGYTGATVEGFYIKPNLIYARANGGLAFVNNLSSSSKDDERLDFNWWSPIVNAEVGYPFRLGIRKSTKKFISDQSFSLNKGSSTVRNTNFYRVDVPQHFLITPVVGINYEAAPFRLQELAMPENEIVYNQRFMTLNAGVRILKLIKSNLSIKDSKSGGVTTGTAHRFGGLYVGMDMALKDFYETGTGFTSIVKSNSPTYEVVLSIPSGYINTIAYLDIGLKSMPYVRKDVLDGRTDGSWQFYLAFKSYL